MASDVFAHGMGKTSVKVIWLLALVWEANYREGATVRCKSSEHFPFRCVWGDD